MPTTDTEQDRIQKGVYVSRYSGQSYKVEHAQTQDSVVLHVLSKDKKSPDLHIP